MVWRRWWSSIGTRRTRFLRFCVGTRTSNRSAGCFRELQIYLSRKSFRRPRRRLVRLPASNQCGCRRTARRLRLRPGLRGVIRMEPQHHVDDLQRFGGCVEDICAPPNVTLSKPSKVRSGAVLARRGCLFEESSSSRSCLAPRPQTFRRLVCTPLNRRSVYPPRAGIPLACFRALVELRDLKQGPRIDHVVRASAEHD